MEPGGHEERKRNPQERAVGHPFIAFDMARSTGGPIGKFQ